MHNAFESYIRHFNVYRLSHLYGTLSEFRIIDALRLACKILQARLVRRFQPCHFSPFLKIAFDPWKEISFLSNLLLQVRIF